MQLSLQIFEDENHHQIQTINIDGDVWFFYLDVCAALDIKNPSDAIGRLDDDEKRTLASAESSAKVSRTNPYLISESGLYNLIFQSRKEEAKRFRKWVTSEVLPQLRKTGRYSITGTGIPNFVRRFNDNWDRVDAGYFSVISELFIRLYGRLEHAGYVIPDKGAHGKEIRPDVSVGQLFSKWLRANHPDQIAKRKYYQHLFPDGTEKEAFQYPHETLPLFIEYVDTVWIPERSEGYFQERDTKALAYLPKLLNPAPAPKQKVLPSESTVRASIESLRPSLKNRNTKDSRSTRPQTFPATRPLLEREAGLSPSLSPTGDKTIGAALLRVRPLCFTANRALVCLVEYLVLRLRELAGLPQ